MEKFNPPPCAYDRQPGKARWKTALSIVLTATLIACVPISPSPKALADEQQETLKQSIADGQITTDGKGIVDGKALEPSAEESFGQEFTLLDDSVSELSLSDLPPVEPLATEQEKRDAYAKGSLGFFESVYTMAEDTIEILNDTDPEVLATTTLGRFYDATGLENMKESIKWIKKCNELRAQEGTDPITGEPLQPLKINLLLMASSQVQTNWSAHYMDHAQWYQVGENLAWGYDDPFEGWYTEEKKLFQQGAVDKAGHYLNIVSSNYTSTGFAVNQYGNYGVTHGQVFMYETTLPGTLSVSAFEFLFNKYYDSVIPTKSEKELSGSTRIGTAVSIARETYPAGPQGVIIAKSGDFPDALAASTLAGAKNYPILLCDSDKLDAELSGYLKGLGGTLQEAILIGDTQSLSEKGVKAELEKFIPKVTRIGGVDRFDTAQKLRAEAKTAGAAATTAVIARAENFPDALSISPYCAADGALMYLVQPGSTLDAQALAELSGCSRVILVGDENSVSSKVESALKSSTSAEVIRLAGGINNPYSKSRYGTSAAIAQWLGHPTGAGFNGGTVTFATGQKFPDALVGGPLCGKTRTPIVLVDASDYSAVVNVPAATQVYWLGSTNTLASKLRTAVKQELGF